MNQQMEQQIKIKDFIVGFGAPLAMMCGPCVIESEEHCLRAAETLKKIYGDAGIPLIFKSSYDKANRSSGHSFRGPGVEEGLRILERVRDEFDLPIVTDVHSPEEATAVGEVCDIVQVPAFLCRQTDLIFAAGKSGAIVSVKKGQFMSPWEMKNVVAKIAETGNTRLILTDRGTSFGYNNLVSDMRAIPIMQKFGVPVCFDMSHSVQLPGGLGESSGGDREFIPVLGRAAVAAGANCLFLEAHPDPAKAKSDAATVWPFEKLPELLRQLKRLYDVVNNLE